ncbi:MAG: hypothetical protein WDA23_04970 [Gemmobacter sp.]
MPHTTLAQDHEELYDPLAARRYFAKFDRITGHLPRVAGMLESDRLLARHELRALAAYVATLGRTFRALSLKYLMTGRTAGPLPGRMAFDRHESGFPVFRELLFMANDAQNAAQHLPGLPSEQELKDQMIRQILGELSVPTRLQFSLSQRLYYEALGAGGLFWARNDPLFLWLGEDGGRRRWFLHWAVYDSQTNLPVIYLMELEDTGRTPLPRDSRRWPQVQAHLMSQSLAGLKLVTVATGFDKDFDDLHPKVLKRLHLGPMYSASFTLQSGPLGKVLAEAAAPEGEDWALAWTLEELEASDTVTERTGWFGSTERQVFALDPFGQHGPETGATRTRHMVILPKRPYQVLADRAPPGFAQVRKFVVGAGGQVVSYRQ